MNLPSSLAFVDETLSLNSSGKFVVLVEHPETNEVHDFYAQAEEPELTLTHVMNQVTFDPMQGDRFDANFISRRNEATQDFDYYVQRMMSVAVIDEYEPSKGPLWHVYINGVLEDWMQIVRLNRIVCKQDHILWRYHRKVDQNGDIEEAKGDEVEVYR